jgi:hypothetical protein
MVTTAMKVFGLRFHRLVSLGHQIFLFNFEKNDYALSSEKVMVAELTQA